MRSHIAIVFELQPAGTADVKLTSTKLPQTQAFKDGFFLSTNFVNNRQSTSFTDFGHDRYITVKGSMTGPATMQRGVYLPAASLVSVNWLKLDKARKKEHDCRFPHLDINACYEGHWTWNLHAAMFMDTVLTVYLGIQRTLKETTQTKHVTHVLGQELLCVTLCLASGEAVIRPRETIPVYRCKHIGWRILLRLW